jgi:hypothetical protein
MPIDLVLFFPLAVLTNTAVPLPFEPVLFYYAGAYPLCWSWTFVAGGSLAAGVAALVDRKLAHLAAPLVPRGWMRWLPHWPGRWFYLWTLLVATSPIPLSVVRLAMLRTQPRARPYAIAVAAGRVPRFLVTLHLWQYLAPPSWLNVTVAAISLGLELYGVSRIERRRARVPVSSGSRRRFQLMRSTPP